MATLQNTDKILVNREDETYSITFGEIADSVTTTTGSYSAQVKSLMRAADSIKDDDLFLVERAGDPYKVTYKEIVDSVKPPAPPLIDNVQLVEANPDADPRFTNQEFAVTVTLSEQGEPLSEKSIDAYVEGRFAEKLRSTNDVTAVSTVLGQWYQGDIDGSTAQAAGAMMDLAYINNTYIGLGFNNSGVWYTSTDGKSWTSRSFNIANSQWFKFCEFNGKVYVTGSVNNRPEILETSDGFTWTPVLSGKISWTGTTSIVGLSAGDTRVIILPNAPGDGFWYTEDFVTYLPLSGVPGTAELNVAVMYGDGVWIWINGGKDFYFRSTDNGDTWETKTLPYSVQTGPGGTYGNDKFITWYNSSNYLVSEDMGLTWEARAFPCSFLALRSLDFANGLYVLSTAGSNTVGFYDSYVMMSSDLINWRKINPSNLINADAVKVHYMGDKFIVGWGVANNYGGTIWSDIPIDCKLLSLAGAYTDGFRESMTVSSDPAGGGASAVLEINDTEVRVSDQGTWAEGQYLVGPFAFVDSAKRYLVYDEDGDIVSFQNQPMDPKWTTMDEEPTLTLKFPGIFPSGLTPDEELGEGTILGVEARAYNEVGSSGPVTATVQPDDGTITSDAIIQIDDEPNPNGGWQLFSFANNVNVVTSGLIYSKKYDRFIAGGRYHLDSSHTLNGFQYSNNQGQSWTSATSNRNIGVYTIASNTDESLYLGISVSVGGGQRSFKSTDGGLTWNTNNQGLLGNIINISWDEQQNKFYATGNDEIGRPNLRSTVDGNVYTVEATFNGSNITSEGLGIHPTTGRMVIGISNSASAPEAIAKYSDDGGSTWTDCTINNLPVIPPQYGSYTFAQIFYSPDVNKWFAGPSGSNAPYFGVGLFSSNDGITWDPIPETQGNHPEFGQSWALANYTNGYLIASSYTPDGSSSVIMVSKDGTKWYGGPVGSATLQLAAVAFDGTWYVGGGSGTIDDRAGARTDDLGMPWKKLTLSGNKNLDKFGAQDVCDSIDQVEDVITSVVNSVNAGSNQMVMKGTIGEWEVGGKVRLLQSANGYSLTQDELDTQKLKFATYENRKMVQCGANAAAARAALRESLIAQGYTETEIDDVLIDD